jgi:hypothetical protein
MLGSKCCQYLQSWQGVMVDILVAHCIKVWQPCMSSNLTFPSSNNWNPKPWRGWGCPNRIQIIHVQSNVLIRTKSQKQEDDKLEFQQDLNHHEKWIHQIQNPKPRGWDCSNKIQIINFNVHIKVEN